MASNTAPPGYQWVESRGGGGGDDPSSQVYQYLAPIPGYVAPVTPPTNTVGGPGVTGGNSGVTGGSGTATVTQSPNAQIAANWQPTASTTAQLAALLTMPNSGYSTNPNYGTGRENVSPGRWQFSGTAPVPLNAPQGWGRYPGVDGAPGNAPWLLGQTMPPPRWGNFNPGGPPPVPLTPPPNTVGGGGWGAPPGTPRTGGTGTVIAPPGTPRNPYSTPGYTNATGTGGQTRVPITATPATINWNNGFGPGAGMGTNTQGVPQWWQSTPENWNATAGANSKGITTYTGATRSVQPVPQEFANYFIPWPSVGRALPAGAFVTLFPNAKGNDWSKVKPENWGPNWRPPGLPNWTP